MIGLSFVIMDGTLTDYFQSYPQQIQLFVYSLKSIKNSLHQNQKYESSKKDNLKPKLQENVSIYKENVCRYNGANSSTVPNVKQSIYPQDDEKRKMANTVDQDDNLDNDQDDDQFSTEWAVNPLQSNMAIAYETLNIQPVATQKQEQTKLDNQKVEQVEKQEQDTKKKVVKMIGKLDEEKIVTKQQLNQNQFNAQNKQDLLDQEPDYFEGINKEQQITFDQTQIINKNVHKQMENTEKSRFQDDGFIDDFNANGWVDDIEIEL